MVSAVIGIAAPCLDEVVLLVAVIFANSIVIKVETPNPIISLVVEEDALVEGILCPSFIR